MFLGLGSVEPEAASEQHWPAISPLRPLTAARAQRASQRAPRRLLQPAGHCDEVSAELRSALRQHNDAVRHANAVLPPRIGSAAPARRLCRVPSPTRSPRRVEAPIPNLQFVALRDGDAPATPRRKGGAVAKRQREHCSPRVQSPTATKLPIDDVLCSRRLRGRLQTSALVTPLDGGARRVLRSKRLLKKVLDKVAGPEALHIRICNWLAATAVAADVT
eukprot:TRINITY_DN44243_c0_g1_i1.p2 TRINITY_DN44243_c0_g1~~TRINITY_DN44243_c0_g1_i1.p2  ORF type:complete len:219 (+),score=46.39 TRINITY_DN44243_c0_g1_i1:67-723(+)